MRDILNTYSATDLKTEIKKYNAQFKSQMINGYSTMKKAELVDAILKKQDKFTHLKGKTKAPKPQPKPQPKKEEPKPQPKPQPKKEEPKPQLKKETPKPDKKEPVKKVFTNLRDLATDIQERLYNEESIKKIKGYKITTTSGDYKYKFALRPLDYEYRAINIYRPYFFNSYNDVFGYLKDMLNEIIKYDKLLKTGFSNNIKSSKKKLEIPNKFFNNGEYFYQVSKSKYNTIKFKNFTELKEKLFKEAKKEPVK